MSSIWRRSSVCALVFAITISGCGGQVTSVTGGAGGASSSGSGGTSTPSGGGGSTTGTAGADGLTTSTSSAPPDGSCRTQEDCTGEGEICFAPGALPTCGICMAPDNPCDADADCKDLGPDVICGVADCLCAPGCIQGCIKNSDCPFPGECGLDHHCGPMKCNKECPFGVDLVCKAGICERMPCDTDADCDHICVLGLCYDSFGVCATPPA